MIKKTVVFELLESLKETVELLRPLQQEQLSQLIADPVRYNGVLHLMHIAVEHVTDISAHLLAGKGLAIPETYREIIIKMGEHGILPLDFARNISAMSGFRNIVVHQYLSVDPALVQKFLVENLTDFERFIEYVYETISREGINHGSE